MGKSGVPEELLERVDESRRSFLRKLILGTAFVVPALTSFSMGGLGVGEAVAQVSNQVRCIEQVNDRYEACHDQAVDNLQSCLDSSSPSEQCADQYKNAQDVCADVHKAGIKGCT